MAQQKRHHLGGRHEMRVLAMQALYQLEARGEADLAQVRQSIDAAPGADEASRSGALKLCEAAWRGRAESDALISELAPDWPTHRQPPVDRAILRLACHEIRSGQTPAAVAINEAVELAKEFGSERSPAFVNGVLDKIARHAPDAGEQPAGEGAAAPATDGDAWLADALKDEPSAHSI